MEDSITVEEALITEWTTAVEALDFENIRELFDIRPELLWTPLTPLSHLETDFAHFIQRLKEHKLLGTSIRPVYALHHILYDYGVPNDEWAAERNELVEFILKHTNGDELNTCYWGTEQNSVMHLAYFNGQNELIQQLEEHGASSDIPNKSGHLPSMEQIDASNTNSQPEVKLLINKSKSSTLKDRQQPNASDRFKKLRELAESPNVNNNKPLTERQNSTRRYFRPGHLEERKRRVLSEEEEAELKRQDSKRQREVAQLAQRSAVKNNPLFKKFEEQQQQNQQAKRAPSISAASAVRERKKLLDAADQVRRSSRVINSLKDRSYVSTSVFRQAQEAENAAKKKKIPTLAQLRAGTPTIKEASPDSSDNEDSTVKEKPTATIATVKSIPVGEEEISKEVVKLNEENNDGVTITNSNVTSGNVPDSLLEDDDKLTSGPNKTPSNLVNTKINNTNISVTENELESLSIGKLGDRGVPSNSKLVDKTKVDISSSKVKDIVNVHEHLNDEEELEIYSVGKKFAVWKKDEVGQNEDEEGITYNKNIVPENETDKADAEKIDDTFSSTKQLSTSAKGNFSTEKTTDDDLPSANNDNGAKSVTETFTQVSPTAQQGTLEEKSIYSNNDKKVATNSQTRVAPINKQSPTESPTNKVLLTAKKLESPGEDAGVKNLKSFGTIKKAASSVTSLKSAIKEDIETNSKDLHSMKSSSKTATKYSNKTPEASNLSQNKIDEKQVFNQATKIDESSLNLKKDIKPLDLIDESASISEKSQSREITSGKPINTSLSSNDISASLSKHSQKTSSSTHITSLGQQQELLSNDDSCTANLKDENKNSILRPSTYSTSNSEDFNMTNGPVPDGEEHIASFLTETHPNTLAPLDEEKNVAAVKEANSSTITQVNDDKQSVYREQEEATNDYYNNVSDRFTTKDDQGSNTSYTRKPALLPSVNVKENDISITKNSSESNQDYHTAGKPRETLTSAGAIKSQSDDVYSLSNAVPEFSFTDEDGTAHVNTKTDSTYQSKFDQNIPSIANNSPSYVDYHKDSASDENRLTATDTQIKKEDANRVLHLEINTNKSQMIIEEVDESDEDEASTPTMANPHTYHHQQQQVQQKKVVEESDDEETRQEWKSAYDNLLSNQQEMDFEDDVLLQHRKTLAKNNGEDDSRLSMSSEIDETSIIQTLTHQSETRVNNLSSKHEQAKKRQSGSQRSHWSTGIQHVDAMKRESLMSKGESVAASSEAGSEQWFDPDDDWTDPQEMYGRESMSATHAIDSNSLIQHDNDYTTDYYYSQHQEEPYRHSDSSINTNSETYSNKNSNSTENTNLDEDEEDERKHYQPTFETEDDDDYYSTNLHAVPTNTISKTRGESSYYNGGQSDNDQDEEGEIVVFMNQFSPPKNDKHSSSRSVQNNTSQRSEDITTAFFNNSSKPSLVEQHQIPKPLTATTTTNFSSSTLSVNNIRGREDDEVSLIKIPSRTVAIAEAGVEQEVLPHDPNNPRVEDISHYMNKLPNFDRNNSGEAPVHGGSAFDAAAMSGSSVGGGRLENETVVIKRAISTTHTDGQPVELDRGIPHVHEIDSAFLMPDRRPTSNEETHKVSMSSIESNSFGKMYIAVSGAHNMLLPLPREITYVRCVISDGEYEYMSRYEILGHQILMDYECVIDTRPGMIITVSLHVRPDYHVKPRTGWTKWFTSIRKQKEHLSGYVHPEDGAIGQTRFAVDRMVPGCYKKTYEASFDCFNSWYARTSRERVRREQFGDEEDFLKIVGKLNVEMLYLPVSSPSVQVPRSLRECDLTLKIRQWHDTCWQSGYLSTRRQGLKIWERHYYRLIGSQLIGYTSDGSDRQVWDHYNISDVVRLSAAADKVIVNLMEEQDDDKVFPKESIHEQNHKGFFRLAFADYHLDCVSDDLEESEAWVKTLKSMIGRIPLRIHFSD